ncbi:MAG TPA: SDR family oxidoreductase [Solirubrobacteraceae bacterium]|nr:SDR family oxidoreductase [Solirubrobacteraceae bacterium]
MGAERERRYEGRRAVVVGGTHGIGLAIAQELLRDGAEVVVTGRDAGKVAAAADALGPVATVLVSDVTDAADRAALTEAAGEIDALFVNAGSAQDAPLAEVTEASWDRQFGVNTKGAFFTTQALAPRIRRGGGIVFTTLADMPAFAGGAVPAASKAAVRAFARSLAAELVTDGIRVNTVAPGFIDTPSFGVASVTDGERAVLRAAGTALTPMGRLGTPDEVARAAIFLALDATFVTGTELQVDGGISSIAVPG